MSMTTPGTSAINAVMLACEVHTHSELMNAVKLH